MVGAAARVAGDTTVITAWVVNGAYTEVVTVGTVAQAGVVLVAEVFSELTIAEVVVTFAKVVIDWAVTRERLPKEILPEWPEICACPS